MSNDSITITWQAFGEPTSATIPWEHDPQDPYPVCDEVFQSTNVYKGALWNALEPFLPANRTHTSLSVGDSVTVGGTTYLCEPMGWIPSPMQASVKG